MKPNSKKPKIKKIAEFRINLNPKNVFIWLFILFLGVSFFLSLQQGFKVYEEKPISQVLNDIKDEKIERVEVEDSKLTVFYKDESVFVSYKEIQESFAEILEKAGIDPKIVNYEVKDTASSQVWWNLISNLFPLLLMVVFFLFLIKQARGAQDSIFSFGRSRARQFSKKMSQVTFDDVAGVDEAKKELEEVVDFLKHPKKYHALGARTPKGVLLVGSSGTGKTLLARALAGEASVPFFSMAGSEFMEMLVGVGASVTGDTPVLIKMNGKVKLAPIGKFVDQFYKSDEVNKIQDVKGVETLGFEKAKNKFWGTKSASSKKAVFEKSSWKKVKAVYRHQVKEIYEVHFLGGKIRTTGDHSVFIRTQGWVLPKKVSKLKPGDILVNLPMNVRRWNAKQKKTIHTIKTHEFSESKPLFLDVWGDRPEVWEKYRYVSGNPQHLFQHQLGEKIGVCQMTVSNWQRGVHLPRAVSKKLVKLNLPEKVEVTPKLMKLFGLYVAEGRGTNNLELSFGSHEEELIVKVAALMNEVFGIGKPTLERTESNTIRVKYYSAHLGRFFARICGNGSHHKHVPEFIWSLPKEHLLAFLEGYTKGDGYITKSGKLCASSVSHQLILELAWLCSMHGIKAGIKHEKLPSGRVIRKKPLPETECWTLIIGKTSNPFLKKKVNYPFQIKRCVVRKVVKEPYDGYVYDLCGVENEAFFGGEKPVLLHNSRVRDLFSTAKTNSPSIIFIDEMDAIGRMRSVGVMGSHDEREQTLNQILVEMDGFEPTTAVLVVAASVTGDTLVLIKQNGKIRLLPIGEFVDQYFQDKTEEGEREVWQAECLGFEKKKAPKNLNGRTYFASSAFKKIKSVFRHKVDKIYEIEYLGGKVRATGSHSVFIRSRKGIETKAVSELRKGDILIDLPCKVNRGVKEKMEIRSHKFGSSWSLTLPLSDQRVEKEWQQKYLFAIKSQDKFSQNYIANRIGVSQGTVSHWQREIGNPRPISREYFKHQFPERITVTPEFCRLLGYYVSEGYARWEVDFCFGIKEADKIEDLIFLMRKVFGLKPHRVRRITPGAVNIVYSAAPLAKFLICHCGQGAKNKHVPDFLFGAPDEYFREFLKGVWRGDGYEDKRGRGEITSVSKQLVTQLNWLCRMHGIKTYIGGFEAKKGRRIKNGKPLKATQAYRLGWGKANNPFNKYPTKKTYPVKRVIVKKVKKVPFKGFVYDLCGVDNEAFFGGESPILLHNTNRGDLLDPALLRPGRFDRRITLDMPDIEGRKAILKIHAKGKPFDKTVNWDKVAKRTVGFSGADLENMLNEAAIFAARFDKKAVDMNDLEEAATKVKLGPEKKRLQSDLDRKMTAYHEAGHAIVTHDLPHMDPVHRISVVSRGMALGFTLIPPEKDRIHETRSHLLEQITAMMGGRAVEKLVFNEMTSGAASDITQATRLARDMVIEYGMSGLGPINFGPQIDITEWGKTFFEPTNISPDMQAKIDSEVKKIIDQCYQRACQILTGARQKLDKIAEELIKKETLEGEDFEKLMGYPKKTIEKKDKKTKKEKSPKNLRFKAKPTSKVYKKGS